LAQHQAQYGHCQIPHNWPEKLPIAQWVKRQRYQYKLREDGKHSTLTDERKESLDQLGFIWRSHGAMWEDHRLAELRAFSDAHGHCNVPIDYPQNRALGIWVKGQRRQYMLFLKSQSQSTMTAEQVLKLNGLGFDWNPRKIVRRNKGDTSGRIARK
jgi:hypothetical protein